MSIDGTYHDEDSFETTDEGPGGDQTGTPIHPADLEVPDKEPVVKRTAHSDYRDPFSPYSAIESDPVLYGPGGTINKRDAMAIILKEGIEQKKTPDGIKASLILKNERLDNALSSSWSLNRYDSIVQPADSMIQASIHDGSPVHNLPLSMKVEDGSVLSGEVAQRHIRETIGAGKPCRITCWHSGFSITVGNFSNISTFRLSSMLQEARDDVGTETAGLIYTTEDVHINTIIIDYILEHVTSCSIKGWTLDVIRKHLDVRDLGWVMGGGLGSRYPNGFPFIRECANGFGEDPCTHSTLTDAERLADVVAIDFNRCCVKNPDRFNRACVRQLASADDTLTVSEVTKYQDALRDSNGFPDTIGPINETGTSQHRLVVRAPSYDLYRTEGLRWIGDVISTVETVLETSSELSPKETAIKRRELLSEYMNRISCQRVSSWVKEIITTGPGGSFPITGREEIVESLGAYSDISTIRDNIITQVEEVKLKHQYSFTAMSNYICPACTRSQNEDLHPEFNLIPINLAVYFFVTAVMNTPLRK